MSKQTFSCVSSLEKTIMKMDPEDGKQIMEYFKAHALLSREKACKKGRDSHGGRDASKEMITETSVRL